MGTVFKDQKGNLHELRESNGAIEKQQKIKELQQGSLTAFQQTAPMQSPPSQNDKSKA